MVEATELLNDFVHQRLSPLPDCVQSICPDESALFAYLDELQNSVDNGLAKQQIILQKAWELFGATGDDMRIGRQTLRMHIYNLHHNQRTHQLDIDSYTPEALITNAPPRLVLRIQGRLLPPNNSSRVAGPKLTSFFQKIVVVTPKETMVWDRSVQTGQELLTMTSKLPVLRAVAAQQSKVTPASPTSTPATPASSTPAPPDNSVEDTNHDSQASLHLIDAAAHESVIQSLADSDGIELAMEGDEPVNVQISFYPAYKTPHFLVSKALEELTKLNPAPITTISRAIWLCARKVEGSKHPLNCNLKSLPCNPTLQRLFGTSQPTFDFTDLPQLLKPHLLPPPPITVHHKIKLTGDILDNEQILDFSVEAPDLLFPLFPKLSPLPSRTDTRDMKETFSVAECAELSSLWDEINKSVSKRNLLLEFAKSPAKAMTKALTSVVVDVEDYDCTISSDQFLKNYEMQDQSAAFYQQPWMWLAVDSYLANKKRNLDEVMGRTLTTTAAERKSVTNMEIADPVMEALRSNYLPKRAMLPYAVTPYTWGSDHSMRVPVFSQMSRHHQPMNKQGMAMYGAYGYGTSTDTQMMADGGMSYIPSVSPPFEPLGISGSSFLPFGGSGVQNPSSAMYGVTGVSSMPPSMSHPPEHRQ